jgi:hypothetical protein
MQTSVPELHWEAPALQTPCRPVLQTAGAKSSSTAPLQSSSTPSQVVSVAEGAAPGVQLSTTLPAMQLVDPARAHEALPHAVETGTKSSSAAPLQSSSVPSQVVSVAEGAAPGVQLSATLPATQLVVPARAQEAKPQEVAVAAKSSSAAPLQSSSTPSQVESLDEGATPGVQLSTTLPATQLVAPARAQDAKPQEVVVATKS